MAEMRIVEGTNYIYGYADGEQFLVTNSTEQICAFLMKYRWNKIILRDFFGTCLLEWDLGFISFCLNQQYLGSTLIPVLAPLQMGESEPAEFVPFERVELESK